MAPMCTVSSCDNVTCGAAVSPQCPLSSRISGMLRVWFDSGGGGSGEVWRSCSLAERVKGLDWRGWRGGFWDMAVQSVT
jgi:hypothetical protein